ncbi:MAG: ribonuclease H-like domain-containing protein [Planctomycetota bacterium]
MKRRIYIDIETTGLSRKHAELTVIGIVVEQAGKCHIVQLFDNKLNECNLLKALKGVDELYSYNGSRFDLPFIKEKLKVDLKGICKHRDLMYDCWSHGLKVGLKAVEKKLKIKRRLEGVDGWMAVRLWYDYINNKNEKSLLTLLKYNKEDVVNLRFLRRKLKVK